MKEYQGFSEELLSLWLDLPLHLVVTWQHIKYLKRKWNKFKYVSYWRSFLIEIKVSLICSLDSSHKLFLVLFGFLLTSSNKDCKCNHSLIFISTKALEMQLERLIFLKELLGSIEYFIAYHRHMEPLYYFLVPLVLCSLQSMKRQKL